MKHDSCNTALKKLKSEKIFKLMESFLNDLHSCDYTGRQEENNKEESVNGEES